jgi:hypothetical protein
MLGKTFTPIYAILLLAFCSPTEHRMNSWGGHDTMSQLVLSMAGIVAVRVPGRMVLFSHAARVAPAGGVRAAAAGGRR